MRVLLFFIVVSTWVYPIVAWGQSSVPSAIQQHPSGKSIAKPASVHSKKIKTSKKTVQSKKTSHSSSQQTKSQQTKSQHEKSDKKSKTVTVAKKTVVEVDQLAKIIDSLPEQDQKILSAIRRQITTWPKEVFDEISDYREFIITSRKIAQHKYDLLSPEAKSALETERHLKTKLSSDTVQTLENLEVNLN